MAQPAVQDQRLTLQLPLSAPMVLPFVLVVAVVLTAVSVGSGLWEAITGSVPSTLAFRLLNTDEEQSVGTLWSVAQMLVLALLLLDVAQRDQRAWRRYWQAAAVGVVLLALDEFCRIHETLIPVMQRVLDSESRPIFTHGWVLVGAAATLGVFVLFLPFLRQLDGLVRRRVLMGAGVFLAGALVVELLGGLLRPDAGTATVGYVLITRFEELLEMAGMGLAVWAVANHQSALRTAAAGLTEAGDSAVSVGGKARSGQRRRPRVDTEPR